MGDAANIYLRSEEEAAVADRRIGPVPDLAAHAAVLAHERSRIVGHVELRHRDELAAAVAHDYVRA
jgi:hypothetical protein